MDEFSKEKYIKNNTFVASFDLFQTPDNERFTSEDGMDLLR